MDLMFKDKAASKRPGLEKTLEDHMNCNIVFFNAVQKCKESLSDPEALVAATDELVNALGNSTLESSVINASDVCDLVFRVIQSSHMSQFHVRFLEIGCLLARNRRVNIFQFSTGQFIRKLFAYLENRCDLSRKILEFIAECLDGGNITGIAAVSPFVPALLRFYSSFPTEIVRVLIILIEYRHDDRIAEFITNGICESQDSNFLLLLEAAVKNDWNVDVDIHSLTDNFDIYDECGKEAVIGIFKCLFEKSAVESLYDFDWLRVLTVTRFEIDTLDLCFCQLVCTAMRHLPEFCTCLFSYDFYSYLFHLCTSRSFRLKSIAVQTLQHILEVKTDIELCSSFLPITVTILSSKSEEKLLVSCLQSVLLITMQANISNNAGLSDQLMSSGITELISQHILEGIHTVETDRLAHSVLQILERL